MPTIRKARGTVAQGEQAVKFDKDEINKTKRKKLLITNLIH